MDLRIRKALAVIAGKLSGYKGEIASLNAELEKYRAAEEKVVDECPESLKYTQWYDAYKDAADGLQDVIVYVKDAINGLDDAIEGLEEFTSKE